MEEAREVQVESAGASFESEAEERSATARSRRRGAFTLIEIMAVVLIIGLLGSLVGVAIFNQLDKANATIARAQIKNLEMAVERYRMDNGRYPTTDQGLEALVEEPTIEPTPREYPRGGYLQGGQVPMDPWSQPYQYEAPGSRNEYSFDIWTWGADGAPGGDEENSDIGNWPEEQT